MQRTSIVVASVVFSALVGGCAPQASEAYNGEPLLRMRGQVSTSALTLAQPLKPALCFTETLPGTLNVSSLPAELQADFEGTGFGASLTRVHIMDVEVEGTFPAEFSVNVYAPPPQAATKPLFAGEPASAWGFVCAVQAEHKAVAEAVTGTQMWSCDNFDGPCRTTNIVMTDSGSRFYAERFQCPTLDLTDEQCEASRFGEAKILTETGGFEHVVALVWDPELVYLAAPAPPGSYTAFTLGAPEGLPAGYHLRKRWLGYGDEQQAQQYHMAVLAARDDAIAETNAIHGTSYDNLPDYADDNGFHLAPPDVIDTFERTRAQNEMESLELPIRSSITPDEPGLTLDLVESQNWLDRFQPPRRLF